MPSPNGNQPPQRHRFLFAPSRKNIQQQQQLNRNPPPPDSSAKDSDAVILQQLWKQYCAPLSQTHHRALTYSDPLVVEMWKLFTPLLKNAAVLPLDPSNHAVHTRVADAGEGKTDTGATPRSTQRPESAAENHSRGQKNKDSAVKRHRSIFVDSDDEAEMTADNDLSADTDAESTPITHVFCIHLQRCNPVQETTGVGYGVAEEDEVKGPFPTCTAEMNTALLEQPRIMLPLLEFLAAVMALQAYQRQQQLRGNGGVGTHTASAMSQLSNIPPPPPFTLSSGAGSGTEGTTALGALFNPLVSRLYCCVVGDTAHPSSFEYLGAAQLGRMITVRGTIVRMSPPRITCVKMAYRCGLCGVVKRQAAEDGLLIYPGTCEGKCRGYKWLPLTEESECEEVQILKMQEVNDFFVDMSGRPGGGSGGNAAAADATAGGGGGGMTKVMEVELRTPWLDHATVGDMVNITGVLSTRRGDRKAGGTQQICIRARSLAAARQGGSSGSSVAEVNSLGGNASSRSGAIAALFAPLQQQQQQQQQQPLWSPDDAAKFYEMSRHPEWFARLANSIAPALYGLRKEKEAVLLAMIGGSSAGSKIGARSNIHLLLVGDPGMGKSQLLRAACTVAPRSAFVCAHTSSSCGLTMTLARDPVSGETSFEAGAVVHGDGGITCIDELDKAAAEHKALLEVMEQESVSIAKAGMVFSMPVHTSVLAAGNPIGGRFDFSKPITSNLNLSPALLSRFDVVVCLRDAPQKRPSTRHDGFDDGMGDSIVDEDAYAASDLTSHVLELHRRRGGREGDTQHPCSAARRKTVCNANGPTAHSSGGNGGNGVLPHHLVQDFILFSRSQCQPTLSREACEVLKHHYLSERAKRAAQGSGGQSTSASTTGELHPVTPRYLQALIRVSEARAKLELRLEVSREDAKFAVQLLQSCLGTFSTEANSFFAPQAANAGGSARKKRNQQEQVVDLLKAEIEQNGGVNLLSHATIMSVCETVGCRNPNAMLHQLNEFGILLSAGGKYKLRGG